MSEQVIIASLNQQLLQKNHLLIEKDKQIELLKLTTESSNITIEQYKTETIRLKITICDLLTQNEIYLKNIEKLKSQLVNQSEIIKLLQSNKAQQFNCYVIFELPLHLSRSICTK
jgi:hypothetical protein